MAAFTHTCFMVTPYDGYVDVCEELADLTPGDHAKKSALFNSGAEAVENAVKIARSATGRDAVAVFDHAYHGRTNLTMAMTAKNMPYKHRFGPFAGEVYRAPMSYPFRDGLSGADAAARAIDVLEKQVGADNLAALAIEPIQGEGGFVVPAEGFLPALSAWASANGIVFIADEIQSGFCRTGDWFACDHEDVVPDLVTTAKGIAGGMPARRRDRPRRPDGRRPRRRPRRHLRRQPGRLRRRAGRPSPTMKEHDLGGRAPRDRRPDARAAARPRRAAPGDRRHPRPRRDDGHRAVRARHHHARRRPGRRRQRVLPPRTAWSPSPAAPGATSSASCPRCRSATPCSTRRSTCVDEALDATA